GWDSVPARSTAGSRGVAVESESRFSVTTWLELSRNCAYVATGTRGGGPPSPPSSRPPRGVGRGPDPSADALALSVSCRVTNGTDDRIWSSRRWYWERAYTEYVATPNRPSPARTSTMRARTRRRRSVTDGS